MARRVFLSYQHRDQDRARGFDLMWKSPHVDTASSVRHLLSRVDSTNDAYVSRKIKEQLTSTSVTVVLVGKDTHKSNWVPKEIKWSLEKNPPNGLLAVRIDKDAVLPADLAAYAPEILDWSGSATLQEFEDAIERAALRAGRAAAIAASPSAGGGANCAR